MANVLMRYVVAFCMLAGATTLSAQGTVQVEGLRMWPAPDNTRLVFDLSAPVDYSVFTLDDPDRIVVDLSRTRLVRPLPRLSLSNSVVKRVRTAAREGDSLRVVLDLRTAARPKAFVLKPYQNYGHRLVLDLYDARQKRDATARRSQATTQTERARDVVIAIDAGHGGEDPGARGRRGTREKDVVLAIARRLEEMIQEEPGMRPVMVRTGDYYIPLRERVAKARKHRADLLVSIHADAFTNPRARGSSVYTLSQRGATSEAARWLAEKENAADLIGGVRLGGKDELLASVLLDLSQTATIQDSLDAGDHVLRHLKKVGRVHKSRVQQAGFVVLKAPDIPSILVETAFISNPHEEAKLRSARHQRAIAASVLKGLRGYFHRNPPPGTKLALRQTHVIARGDTLSEIASRYNVSMQQLRAANGLKSDLLRVGEVLRIPSRDG